MNHDEVPAEPPGGALLPDGLLFHPDAKDPDIRVYLALRSYGSRDSDEVLTAFSRKALAARLDRSVRSVDQSLERLERTGYLVIERRHDPLTGAQQPNVYRVLSRPLGEQQ